MYAWKCWRETRARFFVFLILAVAGVVFMDAAALSTDRHVAVNTAHASGEQSAAIRDFLIPITLGIVYAIAATCACLLGAAAPGGEIDAGTADFLWTRPLRRSTMNWMHWGICVAEIAGVIFIPTMLQLAVLTAAGGVAKTWSLAVATPVFVFAALPILGVTILMTALRRSANGGLIFGLGIILGYSFLGSVLRRYWEISLPDVSSAFVGWLSSVGMARQDAYIGPPVAFPWGAAVRVFVLAVGLPLAAQYVLKKAEV
jgi:ABC-type transport system involved in multi-copper enzyme maturation permease subunit